MLLVRQNHEIAIGTLGVGTADPHSIDSGDLYREGYAQSKFVDDDSSWPLSGRIWRSFDDNYASVAHGMFSFSL